MHLQACQHWPAPCWVGNERQPAGKPTAGGPGAIIISNRVCPMQVAAGKGRWREGQLFPQGWEDMGVFEKGWQLWAGERGFLFWSNKLALGAIVVLAVAWILFRFVGPALGLYTLTNDLLSPPNE